VKKLLILLVVTGLVLVSGAYWFNHKRNGANGEEGLTYASIQWGDLTESVSATGILQPERVFAVGSPLSGRVVYLYPDAEVNRVVHEGDPLLKLDDHLARENLDKAEAAIHMAQAAIELAEADRDGAKQKVDHLKEMMRDGVGFRRDYDEAQYKLKTAEKQIKLAKTRLEEATEAKKQAQFGVDQTIVRVQTTPERDKSTSAKAAFIILERKVVLGQLIGPPASAQLFTLASDLEQMQVHAQVSENDIGKMKVGLDVSFSVYAYPDDSGRFRGKVRDIRPMPNSVHGAVFYDTLIDTVNQRDPATGEWMLRPGMTASVDVILRRHKGTWKIPTAALSFQPEERRMSELGREKLDRWQGQSSHEEWKPIWVHDTAGRVKPIFVRIGGKARGGDMGIQEGDFTEILEWEHDLSPKPDPKSASTYPRVVTAATLLAKPSIFDKPNVKVF
jgi:HlyD family secretion protein